MRVLAGILQRRRAHRQRARISPNRSGTPPLRWARRREDKHRRSRTLIQDALSRTRGRAPDVRLSCKDATDRRHCVRPFQTAGRAPGLRLSPVKREVVGSNPTRSTYGPVAQRIEHFPIPSLRSSCLSKLTAARTPPLRRARVARATLAPERQPRGFLQCALNHPVAGPASTHWPASFNPEDDCRARAPGLRLSGLLGSTPSHPQGWKCRSRSCVRSLQSSS
jgi:hypothetical protein